MFKTLDKESAICKFDLGSFTAWLVNNGKNGHGHSEKSTKAHLSDLRGFITWFEAHTGQIFAPELITSSDLRAYFTWSTQEERVAASTWNRRRISLALFCQFALSAGLVAYNPFQGVPVMESTQLAPLSLNKSDYAKFMRRVEQAANTSRTDNQRRLAIRNRAMIACMVYAGLRESEVCELRPSDLLLSDRKGSVKILDGKGHKSGEVPLGREARLALVEWTKLSGGNRLFEGISARQVQRVVAEIGNQAGLQVHPHMLRHTFIYNVYKQCGSLTEAQLLARHSRIDQTARYAMPHKEDLERAVENL